MASKRGGHAVAAAGGQLYALGGFNSVQAIPSCEVFDSRVSLPAGAQGVGGHAHAARRRAEAGSASSQGRQRALTPLTTPSRRPQMNAWRSIADMADSRAYGSAAALGSTLFAVGGLQSDMQASTAGRARMGRAGCSRAPQACARCCTAPPAAPILLRLCHRHTHTCASHLSAQTHAILIERYNATADAWEHVALPPNANPRRSFLAACSLE